jgi:hypothetical protein
MPSMSTMVWSAVESRGAAAPPRLLVARYSGVVIIRQNLEAWLEPYYKAERRSWPFCGSLQLIITPSRARVGREWEKPQAQYSKLSWFRFSVVQKWGLKQCSWRLARTDETQTLSLGSMHGLWWWHLIGESCFDMVFLHQSRLDWSCRIADSFELVSTGARSKSNKKKRYRSQGEVLIEHKSTLKSCGHPVRSSSAYW